MKRLLVFVFLLPMICISQYTAIPDQNFEQVLINEGYDDVIDGQVLTSNINNITNLFFNPFNPSFSNAILIADLTGIEDFVSLISLNIGMTSVTSLDLSGLPSLSSFTSEGLLQSLILGNSSSLAELLISNNQLTSLDLSGCSSLTFLRCINNNLTCLNLKNGNNTNFFDMPQTSGNNLNCIQVDDTVWANSVWGPYVGGGANYFDATVTFSSDCNYPLGSPCYSASTNISEELNNLSIYPNPTNNLIQIEIENHNGSSEAELYDFTGKMLETTNSTSLSLADYPTGIYLLKVAYGDRIEEVKVVKE